MEAYGPEVEEERRSFPPWVLSIGQKEFGLGNGGTNKKKRGRGKFKDSDVDLTHHERFWNAEKSARGWNGCQSGDERGSFPWPT